MSDIQSIREYNFRPAKLEVDPEIHSTKEAQQLKEACQQFESILWSKLWKEMRNTAQAIGGEQTHVWKQMEDLSMEMASEDLVKGSGGSGLWKMLYDSMIGKLAADQKAEALKNADAADPEAPKVSGISGVSDLMNTMRTRTVEAPGTAFEVQG